MKQDLAKSACSLAFAVVAAAILLCMSTPTAAMAQQAQPEATAVLRHLNSAITWYRQLMAANELAGEPSDIYYLDNARTLARQAVQLAFQSADAELLSAGKSEGAARNEQQNLSKAARDAATRSKETQAKIDLLNGQIARAFGKKQQDLISQRDTLQGELDFDGAPRGGRHQLLEHGPGRHHSRRRAPQGARSEDQGTVFNEVSRQERSIRISFGLLRRRRAMPRSRRSMRR